MIVRGILMKNAACIIIAAIIFCANACSFKVHSEVTTGPVFVVYTMVIANREFPPDDYHAKIDLFYDTGKLWYVKDETEGLIQYRDPMILLNDKGMRIDFGKLPASYFGRTYSLKLYFLPLENGDIRLSGESHTKKSEFHYGPRHRTVTTRLPVSGAAITRSFGDKKTGIDIFTAYLKKSDLYYNADCVKSRGTRIFIPANVNDGTAHSALHGVLYERSFNKSAEIVFPSGRCYGFIHFSAEKKQLIEIRAAFEDTGYGRYLHLYGRSNMAMEQMFIDIESAYRHVIETHK